ncbi:MAG: hypothetical protein M1831_003325 [Alyxoria varia]|nr:MAG: hypothetical protein M1831_003325 [Alyxoria varia]
MKIPIRLHNPFHILLPTLLLLLTCTTHAQNGDANAADESSINARASRLGQSFGSWLATATATADDDSLASAYASLLSEAEAPHHTTVTGRDLRFSTLISQATSPAALSSLHERASRLRTRLGYEEARETGVSDSGSASDAVADAYTGGLNKTESDGDTRAKVGGGVGGGVGGLVLIGVGVGVWWWMARRKKAKGKEKEKEMANGNEGWKGGGSWEDAGAGLGKPELEARPAGQVAAVGDKPELEGTGRVEVGSNEVNGLGRRTELPAGPHDTNSRWELDANDTARRPELDSEYR